MWVNVVIYPRATQGALCAADCPSVARSDIRACNGTAQSDIADFL